MSQVRPAERVRPPVTNETQDHTLPQEPESQPHLDVSNDHGDQGTRNQVVIPDTEDQDEYFNRQRVHRFLRCHTCNNFEEEPLDRVCSRCSERY